MARESFDKEIQCLRMLAVASGAYNREQLSKRLGISVHTLDKTIRRLKDMIQASLEPEAETTEQDLNQLLHVRYYDTTDPTLLFLFRAKSVKESESHRLPFMMSALQKQDLTVSELLDLCSSSLPDHLPTPDEKTIRADLKYLEQIGVIRKQDARRPYRYTLHNALLDTLTTEELLDVYDFVEHMANTQIPAVQGYLLRDNIKRAMLSRGIAKQQLDVFLFKYHYYSRILDEAHLHTILQAIHERRKLQFRYFTASKDMSYSSQNTNPRYEREATASEQRVLPLKVVYDHQYGRWYLIGHQGKHGWRKFRLDGITELQWLKATDTQAYAQLQQALEEKLAFSWVIDTGPAVQIRAKFFHPFALSQRDLAVQLLVSGGDSEESSVHSRGGDHFIRTRVQLQGQWGQIVEEDAEGFIYEITVNGMHEIKPWLRSFGSSCEVLEPQALREELIAEWKEMYDYYASVRENLQLPDDEQADGDGHASSHHA
ncbi:helix-turn-helix transcriptional regulator [Marinicrinis sediminis]|uniref:Helix-turn-helix transcriptional regulator n=1 Tax=Marinicrinis sediminis TaxID=1652465 RepID=A0ABW5R9P7_9BACL